MPKGNNDLPSVHRIELSDGNWWEIQPFLTYRMRRRINEMSRRSGLAFIKELQDAGLDMDSMTAGRTAPTVQTDWMPEQEDAALLVGTVAWSYNQPVSEDSIGARDDREVQKVLRVMKGLYHLLELPEEQQEAEKKE